MIIGRTKSVCPVCLRVLDAEKRVGRDGIYLDKNCPEHGQFSALIWEGNMASYLRWNTRNSAVDPPKDGRAPEEVDEAAFGSYLYSAGIPDPELLIRPGG